jgi:T5SS/PEP-CTERM-associated repeat protein
LGLEASGAGDVTIDGAGSEWSLAFGLNVGLDGAGSLTVRDGGAVTAGDILEIGTSGTVRLAGGTIIADDVVFTGNEFHFTGGTLRLRNDQSVTFSRGAQLGLQELSIPQTFIVDGNLALETSIVLDGGTLTAGSITGGTNVRLLPGATLNVLNQPITIAAGKTLGDTLDLPHAATVNIAQGLNNQGLITGDGSIGGTLTNDVRGQIRVTPGDRLTITGENFVNRGTIHLLGGVLKFAQPATNAADALIAGNGSLATAGMSNSGTIALSGITNVLGDVTNRRGGTILSTGGGPTTFFDDVTNDGDIRTSPGGFTVFLGTVDGTGGFTGQGTVNFEGDLTPGASPATVTFEGNVIFGASSTLHIELAGALDGEFDQLEIGGAATLGGELVIELIDLFSPAAMDTFAILEAGTLLSSFDNVASGMRLATLGGEGSFLVNYDGTTNSVLLSEFLPALTGVLGDTDDDRDVDIDDLNAVRNNFGTMGADDGTLNGDAFPFDGSVSIDDLNAVRNNFGVMAAVPEPATDCLLLIAGIVPVVCRPRRRK